ERMLGRACLFLAELEVFTGEAARARPLLLEAHRAATAAKDRLAIGITRAWLALSDATEGPRDVEVSGIPVLDLAWQLAEAVRLQRKGLDTAADELLTDAIRIERRARVHLLLRLGLYCAAGRDLAVQRL